MIDRLGEMYRSRSKQTEYQDIIECDEAIAEKLSQKIKLLEEMSEIAQEKFHHYKQKVDEELGRTSENTAMDEEDGSSELQNYVKNAMDNLKL